MIPVPNGSGGTAYGVRGPYWSCDRDAAGNGKHTGEDFAAPAGTKVVAARPGTVQHVNYGTAFGAHQIAVMVSDGTRDFYAHMRKRIGNGAKVKAGEKIGEVGAEGNTTGPHLHFERHGSHSAGWSCGVIRDPAPSIKWQPEPEEVPDMPLSDSDLEAIAARVNRALGDWTADGSPREGTEGERADVRIRQLENICREILSRVKKLEG